MTPDKHLEKPGMVPEERETFNLKPVVWLSKTILCVSRPNHCIDLCFHSEHEPQVDSLIRRGVQ